jgi:hypothetical protein
MKVKDLIEALECYNPEADVTLMIQRTYPLLVSLEGVTCNKDVEFAKICEDGGDEDADADTDADETVVYLLEGSHLGYGIRTAWSADRR